MQEAVHLVSFRIIKVKNHQHWAGMYNLKGPRKYAAVLHWRLQGLIHHCFAPWAATHPCTQWITNQTGFRAIQPPVLLILHQQNKSTKVQMSGKSRPELILQYLRFIFYFKHPEQRNTALLFSKYFTVHITQHFWTCALKIKDQILPETPNIVSIHLVNVEHPQSYVSV